MDAAQACNYLINLSNLPAFKSIREHEETLEQIASLLDDLDTFLQIMDRMPDFEPEDRLDREWVEKVRDFLGTLKSYGDKQFLEDVAKHL